MTVSENNVKETPHLKSTNVSLKSADFPAASLIVSTIGHSEAALAEH